MNYMLKRPSPGGRDTAFDLIEPFCRSAPVDLEGMTRVLGIDLDFESELPSNVSGKIRRSDRGFSIEVNRHHSPARRRFTLAHEIAHYLLHRDLMEQGIVDDAMYRSGFPSAVETEANALAAELLMPRDLVRTVYRAGVMDIPHLCKVFGVSEDAMRIRLQKLGLAP